MVCHRRRKQRSCTPLQEKKASTEISLLEETSLSKQCFPKPVQAVFHNSSHWRKPGSKTLPQIEEAQSWFLVWVSKGVFSMDYYHSHLTAIVEDALPGHMLVLEHKWLCRASFKKHGNEWKYSFNLCEFRCLPHLFISPFSGSPCYTVVSLTVLFYETRTMSGNKDWS